MDVAVKGKNVDVTPALRAHAEKKANKIDRLFVKRPPEAQCTLRIDHGVHICDVTVLLDGFFLRGEERSDDMYASIDGAFDKVERQVLRHKNKLNDRFRQTGDLLITENEVQQEEIEEAALVRIKHFSLKPMDFEEAIMQMELLGHDFYVFTDIENDVTSVVYKRKDGSYGLISPEK